MTDFVIASGVTSSGLTISAGDTLTVDSGGTASGTVVSSGGVETVLGLSQGDAILKGGSATFASGSVGSGLTVSSGFVTLSAGAELDGGAVYLGAIYDFGLISGIHAQGKLVVEAGGTLEDSTIARQVTIKRGGHSLSNVVVFEGSEIVSAHGHAYGTIVSSGGYQFVRSGGVALHTDVDRGFLRVSAGALESGILLEAGNALVLSGGVLSGGFVRGGVLSAEGGSTLAGALTVNGGGMAIFGDVASGAVIDLKAGTLRLGNLSGFEGQIAGMRGASQKLDLLGFGFSSGETAAWSQSGTSGTLTVTDGAQVASLTLAGTYAASSFALADDGHGGTLVTDPAPTRFAQAAAGFSPDRGAPMIHAGGSALVSSPPLAAAISGRA